VVTWPAVIKLAEDSELIYIADLAQWQADDCQHHFDTQDRLIDANGLLYVVVQSSEGGNLQTTGESVSLMQFTSWVRAHVSQLGHCCVAKLGFASIAQAIACVAEMDEV